MSLVNVTGILAQMGRGMIQDVSDEMFQIFSERMRAELESGGAAAVGRAGERPPAASTAAPAGAGPGVSAPATAAPAEALDAAALGARVARRSAARWARRPGFWVIVLLILAGILYLLLHRSSSGP